LAVEALLGALLNGSLTSPPEKSKNHQQADHCQQLDAPL
jgi:hypothetical protein